MAEFAQKRANSAFATSAKVAMAEFAQKRANSAITTLALGAKLCKAHTCNIFAQGKFDANLFFHPVVFTTHVVRLYPGCKLLCL